MQELGEEEDEFTKSTSKLQALVKGMTGFDILEQDGQTFKDIYDIMVGIGEKWNELNDVSRASLGEALAGKRNANGFYAVMQNIDRLKSIYQTAQTSEGSAQRAEDVFETTIQYSLNRAKASLQQLSYDFLDSDLFKGLIDGGNAFLQVVDQIVKNLGMIPTILAGGGIMSLIKSKLGGNASWFDTMIGKATTLKTGSTTSSLTKNLKALFTSSVKKANIGQDFVEVTADQISSAKVGTDISLQSFFDRFKGQKIHLGEDAIGALGVDTKTIESAIDEVDGLSASLGNVESIGSQAAFSLSSAWEGFTSILAANPLLTGALLVGVGVGIYKLAEYISKAGERAKQQMDASVTEYDDSNGEIDNINQKLKDVSSQIASMKNQGPLTLVDKAQVENLERTRDALKTQLEIQKSMNKLKYGEAVADTMKAYNENFKNGIPTLESIEKTRGLYEQLEMAQLMPSEDATLENTTLEDALGLYEELQRRMDNGEDLEAYKNKVGGKIASQLADVQSYIDAFELFGVDQLDQNSKEAYDNLIKLRDLVIQITDPDQFKSMQIDKLLGEGDIADDVSKIQERVVQMYEGIGSGDTAKALSDRAQQAFGPNLTKGIIDALNGAELTVGDFFDHLARTAIDGSAEATTSVVTDWEAASERIKSLMSNFDTLRSDAFNMSPTSSISIDDFNLIKDTPALNDFIDAIEKVNGVMTINRQKWEDIAKAKADAEIESTKNTVTDLRDQLRQQNTELNNLYTQAYQSGSATGGGLGLQIKAKQEEIEATKQEIQGYELLIKVLGESVDAYNNFVAAKSAAKSGAMFDEVADAYKALEDIFDPTSETFGMSGEGNPVYAEAIEFVIPESTREKGQQAIKDYLDSMRDYMQTDANGDITWELDLGKFVSRLQSALDAQEIATIDISDLINMDDPSLRQGTAEYLGITEDALRSMLGELAQYDLDTIPEIAEQINFDNAVESSSELASNLSTVDGILSDIMSGKTLSASDIQSLFDDKKLKAYTSALETVNGELTLNANKMWEIREAQVNEQVAKNNALIASYQGEQHRMNHLYQGEDKIDFNSQRNSLLNTRIKELTLYNQSLKETTSAYSRFVAAQSAGNENATFIENTTEALEKINDYFQTDSGVFGQTDVALEAAIKFIIPEDIDKTDKANVKAYLDSVSDLLEKDAKGNIKGLNLKNFLNKAVEKNLVSIDDGVYKRAAGKTAQDWADALGVSLGMVQAGWKQMDLYSGNMFAIDTADFDNWKSRASEAYSLIDTINGALAESASGKGLSFSIDENTGELSGNLIDIYNAYRKMGNLNPNKLFRQSSNGIKLNTEELRKLQAEEREAVMNDFDGQLAKKRLELQDAINQGLDTSSIKEQINQILLMRSAYEGATSAYQRWLDAQSAGEMGDNYDNVRETALSRGDELLKEGLVGTNEFRAIAQMFSNEDLTTAPIENVVAAYKSVDKSVKGTSITVRDFFKEGKTGCDNFIRALVELTQNGEGEFARLGEDGSVMVERLSIDELAQKFGVSTDIITMCLEKIHDYGYDIEFFSDDQLEQFTEAENAAKSAQEELAKISKYGDLDISPAINFNVEDLNTVEELEGKIDSLERLKAEVNLSPDQVIYVNSLIDALKSKLQVLEEIKTEPEISIKGMTAAVDAAYELQSLVDQGLEWGIEVTGDKDVQEAAQTLAELPDEYKIALGIDVEDTPETIASKFANHEITLPVKFGTPTNTGSITNGTPKDTTVDIKPNDQVTPALDSISSKTTEPITVDMKANTEDAVAMANTAIDTINDKKVDDKEFKIKADYTLASRAISRVNGLKLEPKSVVIGVRNNASATISIIQGQLNALKDKHINITTVRTTINKTENTPYNGTANGPYRLLFYNGSAHASGTALARGSNPSMQGNWGIRHNERGALINELGTEVVVRDGRWFTVNDGDPAFTNLKRGDIVFNHKQTEELFKNGYVTGSHATLAHASGTAHAENTKKFKYTYGNNTTTSGSGKSGGGKSSSSGNGKSSGKSNSNNSTDPTKIDWIETMLSRLQRLFDNFKTLAEYYTTYTYQNKELQKAVVQAQQNVAKQQQAAKVYYDAAKDKAGGYWDKIVNGTLKIESISDENTAKAVQEAKDLYEKYLQCTDQVVELRKELLELARTKLDNIVDDYDSLNGYAEQYISLLDAQIERRDTMGGQRDISKRNEEDLAQLKEMAEYYNDIKTVASDYAATYKGQITDNLMKGFYKVGSQEWVDAMTQWYDLQTQAYEAATNVEKLNERIRELNWYSFNEGLAIIEHVDTQLGNTIDLIKDLEVYSNKTAAINENGISQFNLYSSALANARQQVSNYNVALDALEGELKSGMITQDKYNEELRDYREKQMDAVKQVKTYRDAIIDLVKKGIQAETKAMSDLISKRKEDLKRQKEANDYAKTVSDKTKEINKIRAQIVALSGDSTAATQAKIKTLQAELAKQEEELAETRMDHEYDMRTEAMDDELDRFEEIQDQKTYELETSLDVQEKAIRSSLGYTTTQYSQVTDELTKLAEIYGVKLEDFIVNPWKNATGALEEYKRAVETLPEANVSITTDNAVHKNNHVGTAGQSTLKESGTNGQADTPFGKGGPNYTMADATNTDKMWDEITSGKRGQETAGLTFSMNKSTQAMKNPSTYATPIKTLKEGAKVKATGNNLQVSGKWWREVTIDGQKAWIAASDMTKVETQKTTTPTTQPKTPTTQPKTPTQTPTKATDKYKVKASNGLNMRSAAGTGNSIIQTIKNGAEVTATGQTKTVSGQLWRQVTYGGKTGWVSDAYLTKVQAAAASTSSGSNTYALTSEYHLRAKASSSSTDMGKLKAGTKVEFTGKKDGAWWQVKYGNKTGWIYNGKGALKKAATGARNASGLYLTDEEGVGTEAIITKKGVLRQLDSSTVFSKAQTEALWNLSKMDVSSIINTAKAARSAADYSINMNYGSLLTVNGNVDKDALPGLQELLKQACEYTKKDLKQNLLKMGMSRSF